LFRIAHNTGIDALRHQTARLTSTRVTLRRTGSTRVADR
jgi:DNA-directed RNA polymerase specialized sigma24 family protein